MKHFTNYILLLLSLLLSASDFIAQTPWSPLPFGATNIYRNGNTHGLITMKVDSVLADSNSAKYFVWRNYLSQLNPQCDSSVLFGWPHYFDNKNDLLFYDYKVDTSMTFKSEVLQEEPIVFPLDPILDSIYNINSKYLLRMDSLRVTEIFGMTDSMRHFSVLTSDSVLTKFKIKSSKHFGFVELPDFEYLNHTYSSGYNYPSFTLVGYFNDSVSGGIHLPEKQDFFDLVVGDQFLYKVYLSGPGGGWGCQGYVRCLVNSVDSQGNPHFYMSHYDNKYVSINDDCIKGYGFSDASLVFARGLVLGLDNFNGYLIQSKELRLNTDSSTLLMVNSGTGTCYGLGIDGNSFYHKIDPDLGITNFSSYSFGVGIEDWTLKASKTAKGDYGIWPQNLGIGTPEKTKINIYPNPSTGIFYIDTDLPSFEATVTNALGEIVARTKTTVIDLNGLADGIYFLNILSENGSYMQKVILEKP